MQLEEFLAQSQYFSLGHLPTEGFHSKTLDLSQQMHRSLPEALKTLHEVDLAALTKLQSCRMSLEKLSQDIQITHAQGGRVFISGCGATGRLAMVLETIWREIHPQSESVIGFMAGGDYALVKSVENFEDFPDFGARHLKDLGFTKNDLLIAVTEGGETPYVLGTLHEAIKTSQKSHWFVYCNPTETLRQTVERSREAIDHPQTQTLCIDTGPMALSGSTRLQAASVQLLGVGAALLGRLDLIDALVDEFETLDLVPFLTPAIEWESQAYQTGASVLYQSSSFPIAVLTDTTERSPTFSLTPFEKSTDHSGPFSWCYLSIPDAKTSTEAWRRILHRVPRGLDWPELSGKYDTPSILEFDFSDGIAQNRKIRIQPKEQLELRFEKLISESGKQKLQFRSHSFASTLSCSALNHPLTAQVLVKIVLNTLSLAVMGKIGRYEGNIMTWVRPSNGKLIDRTYRYLKELRQRRNLEPMPEPELVRQILETQKTLKSDEAVILKLLPEKP